MDCVSYIDDSISLYLVLHHLYLEYKNKKNVNNEKKYIKMV
jgi:hypothetical protein